jgi:hypothetical protein
MATGGTALFRKLEQLLPGVLTRRYRSLKFEDGSLIPTMADLQVGAAEVVRETLAEVGDADIIGDGAFDLPIVDVSADEDRYRVLMLGAAFSYTFQQERALEFAGNTQQINDRKMMLTQRVIAEKANRIAAFGVSRLGLTGLLNNPNVTLNNSSFNPWTATADALAEFFIDELAAVVTGSNTVEAPNGVLLSIDLDFLLIKKRMPDGAMSVKQYILQNSDYISSITGCTELGWNQLEANGVLASGTNRDRVVLMPTSDPMAVERHIEVTKLAPPEYQEVRNMRRVFPMFHCATPTIVNWPGSMRYVNLQRKP